MDIPYIEVDLLLFTQCCFHFSLSSLLHTCQFHIDPLLSFCFGFPFPVTYFIPIPPVFTYTHYLLSLLSLLFPNLLYSIIFLFPHFYFSVPIKFPSSFLFSMFSSPISSFLYLTPLHHLLLF